MIFGRMVVMKQKSIKRRILKTILLVFLVVLGLLLVINLPIITLRNNATKTDYSNWMSETLDNNQKVVDVAMLGAHDAFTKDINLFSKLDPYETDSIMQGATGVLVKGFIYRQSKTQLADAKELLNAGVRYLDIRLTLDGDKWYTKHNYIASEFEPIATQITSFLGENPGEFLILDFQHISGVDYEKSTDYDLFYDMLNEYGLLDYATQVNQLSSLTYGDLTNNGTQAKIIMISKFEDSSGYVLPYENNIRSNWANSDDFSYIMNYLQEEANTIQIDSVTDQFRVMQAVTTMQMSGSGIIKGLTSWSLINRAKNFNDYLINSESFEDLLPYLPIVMVDYANTNSHHFNDELMQTIMNYNQTT